MNSPTFLLASIPAGLSEKYHLIFLGLVSRICGHHKLYLSTLGNTSYSYFRNMFFSWWLFTWGCQWCPLLCMMCRWEGWPCQTPAAPSWPPAPREGKALNSVHKSIWIWPWMSARHSRPEYEWTNLKDNSYVKLSYASHNKHELTGPPTGQIRYQYERNRWH